MSCKELKCCICEEAPTPPLVLCSAPAFYDYLGHPLCWDCYFRQMSHSTFDKDLSDLSVKEMEELEDICAEAEPQTEFPYHDN